MGLQAFLLAGVCLLLGVLVGLFFAKKQSALRIQALEGEQADVHKRLEALMSDKVKAETLLSEMQSQDARFQELSQKTLRALRDEMEQKQQQEYQFKQQQLDERMKTLLTPLTALVENSQKKVEEIEKLRLTDTASLGEQLKFLNAERRLLAEALSNSKGRGDWGEMQLVRLLEESGLLPDVHYEAQATVEDGMRPDIAVKLPNGRVLYIDVKTVMVNLERLETVIGSENEGSERKKHAAALEKEILSLSTKAYEAKTKSGVDFVVLFVPRESMLRVALEEKPDLIENAYKKRVILASPLILMPVLRVVAQGWQQAQLSENALAVQKLGQELHKRAAIMLERFLKMGDRIEGLQDQYEDTFKALSGRMGLMNQLSKLESLGCKSEKKLPIIQKIEQTDEMETLPHQSGELAVAGRHTAELGL